AVHDLLVAARPGRVGLRVEFKVHRRAFRTPGRAGFVLGAIGHHDLDRVVLGMDISLHDNLPACSGWPFVATHCGSGAKDVRSRGRLDLRLPNSMASLYMMAIRITRAESEFIPQGTGNEGMVAVDRQTAATARTGRKTIRPLGRLLSYLARYRRLVA